MWSFVNGSVLASRDRPTNKKGHRSCSDDGLGDSLLSTLPSSGGPDARNDDHEADNGSANRDDGVGNEQHV
jgi:hypothetical protein